MRPVRSSTVSTRPPLEAGVSDLVSVGVGLGGSEDSDDSFLGGGGVLDSPLEPSALKSANAPMSALSSTRMAMGYTKVHNQYHQSSYLVALETSMKCKREHTCPTATSFDPLSFKILAKTPSS